MCKQNCPMSFDFFSLFRLAQPVYSVRFLLKLITLLSVLTKILSFFSFYLECVKFKFNFFAHAAAYNKPPHLYLCISFALAQVLATNKQRGCCCCDVFFYIRWNRKCELLKRNSCANMCACEFAATFNWHTFSDYFIGS